MRILEFGNTNNPTIILVHGFESPYQIWNEYIEYYREKYHILVPILPGHDSQEKSDFISFNETASEIEEYCIARSLNHIYAIYGMSMGGVLASYLWRNKKLSFNIVILESSSLLPFKKWMTQILIKQYLNITQKARARDEKVVHNATKSMVTEDLLDVFLELLDNITDKTIKNYLNEVGQFKLPMDIDTPKTQIIYFYGGKMNEIPFRKVAKYIKKNYINSTTICLEGKGHCEDALLHPNEWIKQLGKYRAKWESI